jgi:hypothetical protein
MLLMIFNIQEVKDSLTKKAVNKAMKELEDFYGFEWKEDKPKVLIFSDRKDVKTFTGYDIQSWSHGWQFKGNVLIMDRKILEKEQENFSNKDYFEAIKHELSHVFFVKLCGGRPCPVWFWEGVALYTADQAREIKEFKYFLKFHNKHVVEMKGKEKPKRVSVYHESGSLIELLVKKFGKQKLLKLIKSTKDIKDTKKDFENLFKKIYGFEISYKNINELLT